jgi:uncharacterized protein
MGVAAPAAPAEAAAAPGGRRIESIDAIRGLSLLGILEVNIQSFTWGAGDPLGVLGDPPRSAESLEYFLQAAFLEGKFYPIFAFLFGVALALQGRALNRRHRGDPGAARAAARRRLWVLLALGIVHGLLLYYGDVLAAYAICGLFFLAVAPARPRALATFAGWAAAAALLSLFLPLLWGALDPGRGAPDNELALEIAHAHRIYSEGGFAAQLRQRATDEAWQQLGGALTFWPQLLALFALGALAGRLGWLRHPERHALVWRRARMLGLGAGLPCALAGAALSLSQARDPSSAADGWDDVFLGAGSLLAMAYVAAALRAAIRPWCRIPCHWLACAGRLSLTNYVAQSVAMGLLLSGWGLGWGSGATRGQLAGIALGIFAVQLAASRWWLSRFRQGPLEALWRRCTYGPDPA